jgi:uncharacterized protein (TIGR00290 family)
VTGGGWALATAGGKDATLALVLARAEGRPVRWALNVFEGSSGLVRFHGTPERLLAAQARALELEPRFARTGPGDFEEAFTGILERVRAEGARGVVFGNVHLPDIRGWYEERVRGAGLEHREPLWGMAPEEVARRAVDAGLRAVVVSVNLELGDPRWLGRELDHRLVDEFLAAGADPCGERGEYHTFVHDGPGFAYPVPLAVAGEEEREGHRYLRFR